MLHDWVNSWEALNFNFFTRSKLFKAYRVGCMGGPIKLRHALCGASMADNMAERVKWKVRVRVARVTWPHPLCVVLEFPSGREGINRVGKRVCRGVYWRVMAMFGAETSATKHLVQCKYNSSQLCTVKNSSYWVN